MTDILAMFSVLFLPLLIAVILLYGIRKKVPVYDAFIDGAKDGLKTCFEILPFIIGIFISIEALTTSGAMDFIEKLSQPLFNLLGIPKELISIILLQTRFRQRLSCSR